MNWYKGNIAEAVTQTKANNAIFVVFVEGKDESSQKLSNFLNDDKISKKLDSSDFVAIKITSDSVSYMQFASIYQVVPVPSIFFIDDNGTPLEIATGVLASVDELDRKIDSSVALKKNGNPTVQFQGGERKAAGQEPSPSNQEPVPVPVAVANDGEVVCEDGVCIRKPKPVAEEVAVAAAVTAGPAAEASPVETAESAANDQTDAVERARKMLEQKRAERLEAEKKLQKEQELRRRREQMELQKLNDWKKDQEYKEAVETRRRERLEDQEARQRILSKIAADKAERAQKFGPAATEDKPVEVAAAPTTPNAENAPDSTRLQFRFPNGETASHVFQRSDTLCRVREYIRSELSAQLAGLRDFTLATTYPKREFGPDDMRKSLTELALFPSAVVLVIANASRYTTVMNESNRYAIFTFLVRILMSPFLAIYNFFTKPRAPAATEGNDPKNSPPNNDDNLAIRRESAAKRRRLDGSGVGPGNEGGSTSTRRGASQRRYGGSNIHRLSDSPKNSDDENATWNGNSTQQQ